MKTEIDDELFAWITGVDVILSLFLVFVCIIHVLVDPVTRDWRFRRHGWWLQNLGVQASVAIMIMIGGGLWRSSLSWWMLVHYETDLEQQLPGGWLMHIIAMLLLTLGKILLLVLLAPNRSSASDRILMRTWQSGYVPFVAVAAAVVIPTIVSFRGFFLMR